jgi:RNA polymerase subunit RPABC4/transcription elongation factor Spt4
MNVFFEAIYDLVSKEKRICPACHRTQQVEAKYREMSVVCRYCKADIPPIKRYK